MGLLFMPSAAQISQSPQPSKGLAHGAARARGGRGMLRPPAKGSDGALLGFGRFGSDKVVLDYFGDGLG
jgi:hypothetical protein